MSLNIPPAKNYQSPQTYIRSILYQNAPEGQRMIPYEVDWGTMGGPNNCVAFNLSQLGPLDFTQIVALSIDNSACGSDIQFIFTDSQQTYVVPAYAPAVVMPVFTNSLSFYLVAEFGEEPIDITRFAVFNFLPPPIAIPATVEQQGAGQTGIAIGNGTQAVVAPGITGTLEYLRVTAAVFEPVTDFAMTVVVQDGGGVVLGTGVLAGHTATPQNVVVIDMQSISQRFNNGIVIVQSSAIATGGFLSVNAKYRSP